jgi:hypothetical protein
MGFPSYRRASVEELLDRCTPEVRRLVQASRRRILAAVPGATERLRAGWGILGYDAPRYFAFVAPMRDHVRIGFERGVLLPDPQGILEGKGSQVRHVVIRRARDLKASALAALLREAAWLPAAPPSGGRAPGSRERRPRRPRGKPRGASGVMNKEDGGEP